jgi:maltose-binding protein MalE
VEKFVEAGIKEMVVYQKRLRSTADPVEKTLINAKWYGLQATVESAALYYNQYCLPTQSKSSEEESSKSPSTF